MRLLEVTEGAAGDAVRLTGVVERDSTADRIDVYFDYQVRQSNFVGGAADAFAAAMLLPCMRAGERLSIVPPISPRLAFNLPRIRDIFHTWWPELSRIPIETQAASFEHRPPSPHAATFFSGGVDSFYTLLKHRHGFGTLPTPLTHLVFMRGVETRLERIRGIDATEDWIREIAEAVGVEPILGSSNIRGTLQGSEENLNWERNYHGSVLAAIALGLSPGIAYGCIPSAFSYNHMIAHGSTPLVDEMYSTERLQIVHDGSEASRATKVARIIEWDRDLVLKHLRVCFWNRGGTSNCGKCYKCVRTAVPLRVLGVWDQATTFQRKGDDHWEDTIAADHLALTQENLNFAREHGGDANLIGILTRAMRKRHRKDKVKRLLGSTPFDRLMPVAVRARKYLTRR